MAAGEGQVIGCHTLESWNKHLRKASDSNKLIVVDFTASWCWPCRFMSPIVDEFARKMRDVVFLKVDVDELVAVAEERGVEAMPTFILLKEWKLVDRIVGVRKDDLESSSGNTQQHLLLLLPQSTRLPLVYIWH